MPRPRNQTARRAQLVQAATRTVLERGVTNARLRDIAAQAGLTPASVLYYYPDINDLLAAVFAQGTETYVLRRREAVEVCDTAWARLSACVTSGIPFPGEAETTSRLLYELLPVAFRVEAVAARNTAFLAQQTGLYRQVLEEGAASGDFRLAAPADFLARSFVALEDGYGIDVLSGVATAEEVQERLLHHARLMTGTSEPDE
ncbi:TetR/AcrR family transcriptional regulator [Streptomyces griseoaurantiacus]|uniref:Transcriptional regulator, TetR family n=1 Tax=Streptomyces griseoaurantiacus TaxID=68213 RepID=A0A1G7M716_9ACTN|nr:TetR/AcrR family transcriptional regulator [Streptomyces jietaisiensis]SDF57557.1 transcriptional regulator, TetR family [Streptomyces jietaisiensis]